MARLHAQAFGGHRPSELEPFLRDVFFGYPWHDESVYPLKLVRPDGTMLGCLGAMPRPMTFDGTPIRAVVNHNFMVAPGERGGLAAIRLLRAASDQGMALAMSEATENARRIAEKIGCVVLPMRSKRWVRVLQPATLGLHLSSRSPSVPSPLRRALRASAGVLDAIGGPVTRPAKVSGRRAPLDPETLVDLVERSTSHQRLRPVYTASSIAWLLDMLRRSRKDQQLRARMVLEGGETDPVGWFIYYSRPGRIGRVLQVGAVGERRRFVLDHLFNDAVERDNAAVEGQLDPSWTDTLESTRCLFRSGRTWFVARAPAPELCSILDSPQAHLTRLEGEGWLRFAY